MAMTSAGVISTRKDMHFEKKCNYLIISNVNNSVHKKKRLDFGQLREMLLLRWFRF